MKKDFKTLALLLISALLLFSLASCDPFDNSNVSKSTVSSNLSQATDQSKVESERTITARVGEALQDTKWKISLLSAKEYTKVGEDPFITEAAKDKVFLVLFFEVENISDKDDYFNYLYFSNYVDGYSTNLKILLSDIEGNGAITGNVAAGKKLKGYLCLEVSKDWKELEAHYAEIGSTSDKLVFKIPKGDISK